MYTVHLIAGVLYSTLRRGKHSSHRSEPVFLVGLCLKGFQALFRLFILESAAYLLITRKHCDLSLLLPYLLENAGFKTEMGPFWFTIFWVH